MNHEINFHIATVITLVPAVKPRDDRSAKIEERAAHAIIYWVPAFAGMTEE